MKFSETLCVGDTFTKNNKKFVVIENNGKEIKALLHSDYVKEELNWYECWFKAKEYYKKISGCTKSRLLKMNEAFHLNDSILSCPNGPWWLDTPGEEEGVYCIISASGKAFYEYEGSPWLFRPLCIFKI